MRAFSRWAQIERYAEPWVSHVAKNLAIDHHRRRRDVTAGLSGRWMDGIDESLFVESGPDIDRIDVAIGELTPKLRETIRLRVVDELDPDDAAETMGISRHAVLKNTTRALGALRTALGEAAA